jgi:glycerophosphoryl diester phosphodiesterase
VAPSLDVVLDPLVLDAYRAGLLVHPWTFRNENSFLPADFRQGNPASPVYSAPPATPRPSTACSSAWAWTGLFSDNPDTAVTSRHRFFAR